MTIKNDSGTPADVFVGVTYFKNISCLHIASRKQIQTHKLHYPHIASRKQDRITITTFATDGSTFRQGRSHYVTPATPTT
jgi:hypothetical protein